MVFHPAGIEIKQKEAEEKLKLGLAALEKGKEELNKKLAEKAQKAKNNSKNDSPKDDKQADGE